MKNRYLWPIIIFINCTGLYFQLNLPLNHDIGWILYGANRMLSGAEFGKDIIAANPPLIWFLMLPVAFFDRLTGLGMPFIFRIFTTISVIISLLVIYILFNKKKDKNSICTIQAIVILLSIMWMLLSWRDFGQREFLSLVAIMPFTFLVNRRLEDYSYNALAAFFVGMVGGAGFLLKPYMMVVPFCFALYCVVKRGWKIMCWYEFYGLTFFFILYTITIFIFTPNYFFYVIPLIRKLYWGFNNTFFDIISSNLLLFVVFFLWVLLSILKRNRLSCLQTLLLFLVIGYTFSLLIQSKGYTYHVYPVTVTLSVLIMASIFHSKVEKCKSKYMSTHFSQMILCYIFVIILFNQAYYAIRWTEDSIKPTGELKTNIDMLVNEINRLAPSGKFTVFGTHPFPGFPTALFVKAQWVGRSNSHIAIPAIVKSMEKGEPVNDYVSDYARIEVLNTLRILKPDVVLVDQRSVRHAISKSDFNFIDYYSKDPDFKEEWKNYKQVSNIDSIIFYKLQSKITENTELERQKK